MSAEALRGGGGADSFIQFPLEKGSRKVYNYSTLEIHNEFGECYNFLCPAIGGDGQKYFLGKKIF